MSNEIAGGMVLISRAKPQYSQSYIKELAGLVQTAVDSLVSQQTLLRQVYAAVDKNNMAESTASLTKAVLDAQGHLSLYKDGHKSKLAKLV